MEEGMSERDARVERVRLVVLDYGEGQPTVVGAISRSTWEIFGEEEWENMRRRSIDALGMNDPDCEVKEVEITLDADALADAVATPTLSAEIAKEEPRT
jgi:hypothetical protein